MDAPAPSSVDMVRSFLGLLNFYGKFIRHMATICDPLYRLLRKGLVFRWGSPQQAASKKAKEVLSSASVLVHYDPEKELCVSCHASPYGVGAVLAQRTEDPSEQPIVFASRRLMSAEENYSQLDKEALAVVFAVKKFHQYLYGRNFSIFIGQFAESVC